MKASVYIATSLDGFIAREDGGLDWLPGSDGGAESAGGGESEAEDYGFKSFFDSIDLMVMGRNTYDMVLSFGQWPYGDKRVVVLSHRPVQLPAESGSTVESMSGSPDELIERFRKSGAKHAYVDGGKTVQSFLNAGFINEIIITTIPVLIGSGIPLFGPLDGDRKLRHVETLSYDNGLVQSRYEVIG